MDDALRSKVDALKTAYGMTLPKQVAELDVAVRRWQVAPRDAQLARDAASIAHRLCGTSGSFGFQDICDAAKAVESLVRVEADALDTLRVTDEMRRLTTAAVRVAEPRK
jgi:hypothetical protein